MNTCMKSLIVLLVIASAASAQVPGPPGVAKQGISIGPSKISVLAVEAQVSTLKSQAKQLEIQLSAVDERIRAAKQRQSAGLATPDELAALETKAAQLKESVSETGRELTMAERLKMLADPVDVTLKSSTIRQAAGALSLASKLKIAVDLKVPQDIHVNAEAQGVPLGAVIEVIANSAGLVIAPSDDGGLLLRMQGKLVVDATSYVSDSDSFPWSDDWGIGRRGSPVGRIWLGLFDGIPSRGL